MDQSRKKTSSERSSGKGADEAKEHASDEEFEQGHQKEEESPSVEMMFEDESLLSDEQKVGRINELYDLHVHRAWLVISLWVILNVLKNDLKAARSKSPLKENSFNKIANSKDLHPDLKGPVLRRWVWAGATWQEAAKAGVNTDPLTKSHCREIAKIPTLEGRISVAKQVVAESWTVKQTIEAVQAELAKAKGDSSAESDLCGLAEEVLRKLDDPVSLCEDEEFCDILLDSTQVRAEFNFREQSKIYDKAEKVKKMRLKEKNQLEERLKALQKSVNFLEDLMRTFDGKDADSQSAA
jgi:hypothetical protein